VKPCSGTKHRVAVLQAKDKSGTLRELVTDPSMWNILRSDKQGGIKLWYFREVPGAPTIRMPHTSKRKDFATHFLCKVKSLIR